MCVFLPELVILTGVLTKKIQDSYYSHTSETTHRLSYGEEYCIIRCLKFNFGISHISDLLQRISIQYIFTSNYLFQILKLDPIWINNERIRFSSFGLLTGCEINQTLLKQYESVAQKGWFSVAFFIISNKHFKLIECIFNQLT